ncbi:MAG: murein biosynthesis integral membrane protein MurJ [Nitrospinae bacterium]|nr:murein biosynthesis integral membrane protein MurJ [Nitrospinota bacterium]
MAPESQKEKIIKAAGVVSAATLVSRVIGYARDMLIAHLFGATTAADAFFVAFRIPNLLRRLTAEGAMTAAFVPVYTEVYEKGGKPRAFALACNIVSILGVALAVVSVAGVLSAPWVVKVMAPGFTVSQHTFELTTLLTRIMFPYLLFVSLAAVLMAMQNSMGKFFIPAAAPTMLNVSIISCALLMRDWFEEPTVALAVGVMLGGVLQLWMQLWELKRMGWRFIPSFDFKDIDTRKIGLLMAPATVGMAVAEINTFVDTLLASLLPEGSISYLYYGNRLVQFPLGVFGVAVGVASLPAMSLDVAKGGGKLVELMSHAFRLTLFIAMPATVGLVTLAGPIANVLFERGEFDSAARYGTMLAIIYYAIGLPAFSGVKVVVGAFYALKDTKTPTRIGAWCMVVNVALCLVFMGPLAHGGLALATSLASFVNMGVLLWLLRKKIGPIDGKKIVRSLTMMALASAVMGGVITAYAHYLFSYGAPLLERASHLMVAVALGTAVYYGTMLALGSTEAVAVKNRIVNKLKRGRG